MYTSSVQQTAVGNGVPGKAIQLEARLGMPPAGHGSGCRHDIPRTRRQRRRYGSGSGSGSGSGRGSGAPATIGQGGLMNSARAVGKGGGGGGGGEKGRGVRGHEKNTNPKDNDNKNEIDSNNNNNTNKMIAGDVGERWTGGVGEGIVVPAERVVGDRLPGAGAGAPRDADNGVFKLKVGQVQVTSSDSLDFSTEEAVPGLMWLPIGLKDVASGNPWVTMCLIDYKHYQENPSGTPMFAHLNSYSKCGVKRRSGSVSAGMVEVVRMSSLLKTIEEQGRKPVPPKGFIYHETRCGSTLVANMLAALPTSRVFSESKPPTQVIRECTAEDCDKETLLRVFRGTVELMGRSRKNEQHEHLYFKFQNSKFLPEISEAYPEVPWIFVFRDPVEVMVSNLKSFAAAPCVRIPRQEKLRKARKMENGALVKDGAGGG
ncbi:unnamed protein product, partial [Pylaiella littoralis]